MTSGLRIINHLRFLLISALLISVMSGCASDLPAIPEAPTPPQTRWQTIDEVRGKGLAEPESEWIKSELSLASTPIGVLGFDGDERGRNSATQDVNKVLAKLSREGQITAVDRDQIDAIRSEIDAAQKDETTLKPSEIAKMVGERIAVRYLLYGAVLQYNNQQMAVPLKKLFLEGELDRYRKEYVAFMQQLDAVEKEVDDSLGLEVINPALVPSDARPKKQKIALLRNQVWTAKKYEQDIEDRQRTEFASIATVGLNARLIDVKTGSFVWFFEGEFQGASLNKTMDTAVDSLVQNMLIATPNKE